MFILKKILNSSTTSPDTARLPVNQTKTFKYGDFLKMDASGVLTALSAAERPTHVCCENLSEGEKPTVLCYPITDEMVFSAPASSDVFNLEAGSKLILLAVGTRAVDTVAYDGGEGNVYLYEKYAPTFGGRVLIRFAI